MRDRITDCVVCLCLRLRLIAVNYRFHMYFYNVRVDATVTQALIQHRAHPQHPPVSLNIFRSFLVCLFILLWVYRFSFLSFFIHIIYKNIKSFILYFFFRGRRYEVANVCVCLKMFKDSIVKPMLVLSCCFN